MQHVDRTLELYRVDRSERVAIEIRYDLKNACTSETGERLGVRMLTAFLRRPERNSNGNPDRSCFDEPTNSSGLSVSVISSPDYHIVFLL